MSGKPQKLELTWFNKDKALIPTENGKYGYTWVDPKDPRYCETHTIVVDEVVRAAQSPKEDGTEYSERADLQPTEDNLVIVGESGDVLEALTRVPELAEKYVGQVKCIYIDPPFNTAQTFANYEDNLEHSIWLTMMRDRLVHLRTLLSNEGSIWVHLDNVENHRMRVVLDEVFGAGNFVAEVVWEKLYARKSNNAHFSPNHDQILVYSKVSPSLNKIDPPEELVSRYKNPDEDPRGPWQSVSFSVRTDDPAKRGDYRYEVKLPSGRLIGPPEGRHWNGKRHRYESLLSQELLWFGASGDSRPREKVFLDFDKLAVVPMTIWPREEVGDNDEAKKGLKKLLPEIADVFPTPKPERLIERIIQIATEPGDLVLDVFGGSGTTAAVAHKMGRRWITCELIEDNVQQFMLPRLRKVINAEDTGGITVTKGSRVDNTIEGLPEGLTADEAMRFNSLLTKVIKEREDLKKDPGIKAVKEVTKTKRARDIVNWRGGGGFTIARLSDCCFDYDPELDLVTLTEAATGQTLINSIAANLNFRRTPKHRYFHGVRGLMRLVVVEGRLDKEKVDDVMAHLSEDEGLTIAATEIEDGVRQYLRALGRGCRAVHIPNDIFPYRADKENS